MKRRAVRIICSLLNFTGINVEEGQYSLNQYLRLCTVLFLLLCTHLSLATYAYINRSHFQESINTVAYTGSTVLLLTVMLKFIHTRQDLRFLIESINRNVFTYSDEANIPMHYDWLLDERNILKVYGYAFCYQSFGFALAGISPFIGYMFGKKETFLLYPGWTPWTIDNFGSFAITYNYQSLTAGCVFWIYYLAQVYVIFVISEFLRQYRRLRKALCTIEQRTKKLLDGSILAPESACRPKEEDVFANQLRECIRHHQILVKLFRIFKSWFEVVFMVELTLGITSFAFVFYNLLLANRYETYLSLMGAGFVAISSLFTRCFAGEIFSAMNARIAKTIFYDINWLKLDKKNRRLICMFHFYVHRQSLDLFAFSIFKASFFTFTGIIRMTYSYFNILRNSLKTG